MIKLKYLSVSIAIFLTSVAIGQNLEELKNYEWDSEPTYFADYSDTAGIVGVKDKLLINFEYTDQGNLVEYKLIHKAFILNSDKQIERYNKLYLPSTSASSELVEINARVLNKNGKIHNLDKSKVLTSKDEETEVESKYYAFEGVEKGSIIEYFYILKKSPSYSGRRVMVQRSYASNNYEFDLYSPINLIFKIKSYNDLTEVAIDTNATEYNHLQLNVKKVDGLASEGMSAYHANKKYFIYKLDENTGTGMKDVSSYSGTVTGIYNVLYKEKTKKESKAIKKLIDNTNCNIARNKKGKIRAIEDYLKSTFYVLNSGHPDLSDIRKVIKSKTASETGLVKLYVAIFNELGIKHRIVLTTDRFNMKFDKKFEAINFLTDYLIYFPKVKSYLSPVEIGSRLGFPPYELTHTYGLFIKEVNVNNMKTAVAKIRFIESAGYQSNFDNMFVHVDIDTNDVSKSLVKFDKESGGYYAINIQPFMNYYNDEDKSKVVDEQIKFIHQDVVILKKKVFFDDAKYFGVEPFKVSSEFHLDPFIEQAGKTVILKVGDMIGPQSEMYQEKARVLPLEHRYRKNYHRVITINVPKKFTVKNLKDINIENSYVADGDTMMSFSSSYTFVNNVLTITVDEYYKMLVIEPKLYNTYRKVMNSAADFNKVSLVLE